MACSECLVEAEYYHLTQFQEHFCFADEENWSLNIWAARQTSQKENVVKSGFQVNLPDIKYHPFFSAVLHDLPFELRKRTFLSENAPLLIHTLSWQMQTQFHQR